MVAPNPRVYWDDRAELRPGGAPRLHCRTPTNGLPESVRRLAAVTAGAHGWTTPGAICLDRRNWTFTRGPGRGKTHFPIRQSCRHQPPARQRTARQRACAIVGTTDETKITLPTVPTTPATLLITSPSATLLIQNVTPTQYHYRSSLGCSSPTLCGDAGPDVDAGGVTSVVRPSPVDQDEEPRQTRRQFASTHHQRDLPHLGQDRRPERAPATAKKHRGSQRDHRLLRRQERL